MHAEERERERDRRGLRREGTSCTKIGDLPGYFHNPMYPPPKDFENYYTVHLWFH
jgi:hypothetical protein